jgi:hypothetical protein
MTLDLQHYSAARRSLAKNDENYGWRWRQPMEPWDVAITLYKLADRDDYRDSAPSDGCPYFSLIASG